MSGTIEYASATRPAYIYALVDPITDLVRYIGKTIQHPKTRYNRHMHNAKYGNKSHLYNWIRHLLSVKLKPILLVLEVCNISNVDEKEIKFISLYKEMGNDLTNIVDGGTGGDTWSKLSEDRKNEIRKKLSEAGKRSKGTKGRPRSREAVMKSQETRRKNALNGIGYPKHTEETKRKISESRKADLKNSERLRKLSLELAERKRSNSSNSKKEV